MDLLRNCISNQVNITEESPDSILGAFKTRQLKNGVFLLEFGGTCRELAFIASGHMRMYDVEDGKEITLWIGTS